MIDGVPGQHHRSNSTSHGSPMVVILTADRTILNYLQNFSISSSTSAKTTHVLCVAVHSCRVFGDGQRNAVSYPAYTSSALRIPDHSPRSYPS